MPVPFNLNPDESILYRSQPARKWYVLAWRIGVEVLEVIVFILFSFTALDTLANGLLASFLPSGLAETLSRVIFQDLVPVLIIGWFFEDVARIFTAELVLTTQRLWTRGYPFAWTPGRETSLSEIKSMTFRRDALFIRYKSSKKTQVHVLSDGKEVAKVFSQFRQNTNPE